MSNSTAGEELVDFTYKNNSRRGYPEVVEYLRTHALAQYDYEDATADARHAYNKAVRQAQREASAEGRTFDMYDNRGDAAKASEARDVQHAADNAADTARREARLRTAVLLSESPHVEVKWIYEHCLNGGNGGEVEEYARDILAILPATTEEIWEEAKENRGMCDVFDRLYNEAEADGVFNGGNKLPGGRELAAFRNFIRRNYGESYVRDMQRHIDPVVKAIRDDYEFKQAEAKAEWQRLDEARAEQEHRNRSEGARRAAETRRQNAAVISTQFAMTGEIIRSEVPAADKPEPESARPIDDPFAAIISAV